MFNQQIEPGQIWKSKSKHSLQYIEIINYVYYNKYVHIYHNNKYYFFFKEHLDYWRHIDIPRDYQLVTNPKKLDNIKKIIQEIKLAEL